MSEMERGGMGEASDKERELKQADGLREAEKDC